MTLLHQAKQLLDAKGAIRGLRLDRAADGPAIRARWRPYRVLQSRLSGSMACMRRLQRRRAGGVVKLDQQGRLGARPRRPAPSEGSAPAAMTRARSLSPGGRADDTRAA